MHSSYELEKPPSKTKPQIKEDKGMSLISKGKKGLISVLFGRLGLVILLLIVQVFAVFAAFFWMEQALPLVWVLVLAFSAGMFIYLINSSLNPTAKISWLILIMLFPVFVALLFWFTQSDLGHRMVKQRMEELIRKSRFGIQ